ncbi:MAG: ankyrin repeat domain-containing protein [Oscillospiraceae bacterium]|nr:ankyrin repeat domain-containing protein [Oscillospiraceae bacterium]
MAKRKTLPKDFSEILERGDAEEIKAVFDRCDFNAYDSSSSRLTALMHPNMPPELIRWLTEQGADINRFDAYHRTALHYHAYFAPEHIPLLLELGANPDICEGEFGDTPLHYCAGSARAEGVAALLQAGADPEICCGWSHDNALMNLLKRCRNIDIPAVVGTAEILLEHGMQVTEAMQKEVTRIGTEFEFHRRNFNPEYLEEYDAALKALYRLFGTEPVPQRKMHDGKSPIRAEGETWQAQYQSLWEQLVPGQGAAETLQGEAIRVIGRLANEVLDNGACNWDADFRKMVNAFAAYLAEGTPADEETRKRARHISPETDEQEFAFLTAETVRWIAANPMPLPLPKPDYRR